MRAPAILVILLAAQSGATPARGQTAAREFDVVSIRPNRSGALSYRIRTPAGLRFTATNVTARILLLEAFDIKDFQLSGAPAWAAGERYDIDAKIDASGDTAETITPDGLRPLLRGLLVSRFRLRFHRATRTMPVFALVREKNGPSPRRNTGANHQADWGSDHINAQDVTMAEFGHVLETQLDRVVVDDTKIPGAFDFKLTWTPDMQAEADRSGPSLFTALREQYGLRLKSRKGPVATIVVDALEKPSGN